MNNNDKPRGKPTARSTTPKPDRASELKAWKAYCRRKALALTRRGYGVEWVINEGEASFKVWPLQRPLWWGRAFYAEVDASREPTHWGIGDGRIFRIGIYVKPRRESIKFDKLVYAYEDGDNVHHEDPCLVDDLHERKNARAARLYQAIIEVLN